jgi:hypothetical protein
MMPDPILAAWLNDISSLETLVQRVRDDEARRAANDVERLPFLDHGRTVNRNDSIMAARRGLPR